MLSRFTFPGFPSPAAGTHNIVYVATENDSVYAFDADKGGPPIWHASLLEGGTPVPFTDFACDQIVPQVGITSTPVIDPTTGTLYVVAMVKHDSSNGPNYAHRLHGLDITTGAEKFGGPVTIAGSVPGVGEGQVRGTVAFDPFPHLNRPGLALANGVVYIAFGSHCDMNWFHGWVFAYNVGTSRESSQVGKQPDDEARLARDIQYDPQWLLGIDLAGGRCSGGRCGGQHLCRDRERHLPWSRLRQHVSEAEPAGKLAARRSISSRHYDQKILDEQDIDLGASGPILLPDQPGSHPHLVVGAGKSGAIYVVDRDRMGRFVAQGNDRQIVQVIRGAIGGNYATPAYWNGYVYFGSLNDSLKAFSLTNGRLSAVAVSHSAGIFGYPGTSPSVSADDTKNGIVWALQNDEHYRSGPAVLHAYDATDLSRELYNSSAAGARDVAGPAVKFTSPTIANGKVYIGTQNSVDVYGLLK